MYLYSDGNKHNRRDHYLVVSMEGEWCSEHKFRRSQLRKASFRVRGKECYLVPTNIPEERDKCTFESTDEDDGESYQESLLEKEMNKPMYSTPQEVVSEKSTI